MEEKKKEEVTVLTGGKNTKHPLASKVLPGTQCLEAGA